MRFYPTRKIYCKIMRVGKLQLFFIKIVRFSHLFYSILIRWYLSVLHYTNNIMCSLKTYREKCLWNGFYFQSFWSCRTSYHTLSISKWINIIILYFPVCGDYKTNSAYPRITWYTEWFIKHDLPLCLLL